MIILLFILLTILTVVVVTTYKYGIGPTPTSPKVKASLMQMLPKIPPGDIYELGAGWGGLAFALADHYKDHRVIAIEISIVPFVWMKLRQLFFRKKNLKIVFGDFFKMNLMTADLIICYLYPAAMQKLEPLVADKWVVSHTFAFPHRKADQIDYAQDLYHTPIYVYERKNHFISEKFATGNYREV